MPYFIAGIDTNVGKTLVAAIVTEALAADYWKPIQTGSQQDSDRLSVQQLVSPLAHRRFFPEAYCFKEPASPHYAAALENSRIELDKIEIPKTQKPLVIEGAGGLMVPLNDDFLLIDWVEKMQIPVILVIKNYLGSINHSLLSIEALQRRKMPIAGLVFNGQPQPSSEDYILQYSGLPCLAKIHWEQQISSEMVLRYAPLFKRLLDY